MMTLPPCECLTGSSAHKAGRLSHTGSCMKVKHSHGGHFTDTETNKDADNDKNIFRR